jgi:hypothetical protein
MTHTLLMVIVPAAILVALAALKVHSGSGLPSP